MLAKNHQVAEQLREIAQLLRGQQANPFRVNAYLHAADTLDHLQQDVADILQADGIKGLVALPSIGEGIAHSIYEYVATGRMSRLESLKTGSDPLAFFRSIPTIGRAMAERIHDELHIDSLEALANAVRDGRLKQVAGLGSKRRAAIESWLRSHLEVQQQKTGTVTRRPNLPTVETILQVDKDYREKAAADRLPRITPKRFNPDHKAWLPILHVSHDEWHFTALYSNTARAHQLGHTRDWVVIYYYDDRHHEDQNTVVTETTGRLKGKRVVRGREAECLQYYDTGVA